MSRIRFAPGSFVVAYCCVYVFCFANDWPMFRYYPLHGDFTWGKQVLKGVGPAMAWYGLMANAAVAAIVVAVLLPQRAVDRLFRNFLWLFPVAAMLVSVFLLRRFLFSM
jgi:hypothetical protein